MGVPAARGAADAPADPNIDTLRAPRNKSTPLEIPHSHRNGCLMRPARS